MMPSPTGPHSLLALGSRTTRLSFLGGSVLGATLALGLLTTSWQEPAQAAVAHDGLSDKVLEGVLLDHMAPGEADRALRYLVRFHREDSVRQWAQQELAVHRPPPAPVTVWTAPVDVVATEVDDAPSVAPAPAPRPSPTPETTRKKASTASPVAPRKGRARTSAPAPKKARAFEASKFLPRADLLPSQEVEAAAPEPADAPPETAPTAAEASSDAGSDAAEPTAGPPEPSAPPAPPPEPAPSPEPEAPTPVPHLSVDGLSLSDRFLSSEEVVLALAGLEERAHRCWAAALSANPDPELGGEVTMRFRLHNGRPALVKAVHDETGSDSFVPCINRLLRKADYGAEARGVVEWTLLVDNGA